ncbi:hypothetical protein MUN81_05025 [Hymenobacter sp. 5317J-9]|uniref:hypothetical protein n=1 Tax=Hymenobacter sp. 5317J-9 TaxID=2932250 RepID=UPI001FD69948|nr:hypothetical protein [Hymenobacter sp. 5317J-9]UOQ98852.1 hypothetical protein MUN81_05025 [Hymenobacter sp. 5317J-9]
MQAHKKALLIAGLLMASCGWVSAQGSPTPAPRLSQAQAAHQFLRAVLRADYAAAYRRMAPEVRHTISLVQFETSARPLWRSGQKHRQAIELYKLGVRLGDGGASRLFYAFSFAADSARKPPPVLLEVTFRDTAARAVLGFGLRANTPPLPAKPSVAPRKR